MRAIRNNRTRLVIGILALPLSAWLCYSSFVYLIRGRDARDIGTQIAAARTAVEKMPPGVERVEEFVRRLKAIDSGHAAPHVKQVLAEYTDAMERSLALLKQHQDTIVADQICAEKAKELSRAIDHGE